ncbi:MAG: metal-sensing transcriptional repressor [Lachnospiraceae bacterium]|nr:metal-sensing transcriptional repressor [Lachnospiraceae bacterium]
MNELFSEEKIEEKTGSKKEESCCCPESSAEEKETCGCKKHKFRNPEEKRCLMNRLKRIEGQIRGIERMVDEDTYCPDILIQVSAVNSALNSFNKELLGQHIKSCVVDDIRAGNDETIDELVRVIQKIMK